MPRVAKIRCFKCGQTAPLVKFSWTDSGTKRLTCDACFAAAEKAPRPVIEVLETYTEGEFTVNRIAPGSAEGGQWHEWRKIQSVWYGV